MNIPTVFWNNSIVIKIYDTGGKKMSKNYSSDTTDKNRMSNTSTNESNDCHNKNSKNSTDKNSQSKNAQSKNAQNKNSFSNETQNENY